MKNLLPLIFLVHLFSYKVYSEDSDVLFKRNTYHLKNMYAESRKGQLYEVEEHGTAFLVHAEGYGNFLITANHCVKTTNQPLLSNDSEDFLAKVIYRDAELDIAILKCKEIENRKNTLKLHSSDLKVGDILKLCHYPRSIGPAVSSGLLMMIRDRDVNYYASADKFFSGSSGCPVFDKDGKVIGVGLAGLAENGEMKEGRCFFLPAKRIFQSIAELKPFFSKL